MSDEFKEIKDEEKDKMDESDSPQAEQPVEESGSRRDNNSWIAGVAIIIVGVVFLIGNFTDYQLNNWWAIFILIPGIFSFVKAWNTRKADGRWSKAARGSLIGGLGVTLVAVIFLFDLDWGKVWPLFLILGGVAALLGGWFNS